MLTGMETPSARASSSSATPRQALDRAVEEVASQRRTFARLSPAEKGALLTSIVPLLTQVAPAWVAAGCQAKGLDVRQPLAGEEWLGGPMVTVRNVRLLAESLRHIAKSGRPPLGRKATVRADNRLAVEVFPASGLDAALHRNLSCVALLEPGIDEHAAAERQASFYRMRDPEGKVSLVLGAGNVAVIPAADVLFKMFVEGHVCVLKMNPVNEWAGPFLEQAFAPLIARKFLRIVYGDGEVGAYLCSHPGVEDIHITGSNRTHDLIVWGPPGPEQERRRRENDPVLKKSITSELGNVSPVMIVPGDYTEEELWFQARNLVTMVVNNGSFNCNAAKMLVTARGWGGRARFLQLVEKAFSEAPPRFAYYPGARDRYNELLDGRGRVQKFGEQQARGTGALPWALITDLDPADQAEPLFRVEPFCGLLSQVEVGDSDPTSFLRAATTFCNERLWGTLNAAIIIDPRSERDPDIARALDRAILDLRYGTVAVNHWPALVFGAVSPPWGGIRAPRSRTSRAVSAGFTTRSCSKGSRSRCSGGLSSSRQSRRGFTTMP